MDIRIADRRKAYLAIGFAVLLLLGGYYAIHGYSHDGTMTEKTFGALRVGETRGQVEKAVGTPLKSIDRTLIPSEPAGESCVYYSPNATTLQATVYQLCYDGDTLAWKNRIVLQDS